MKNISELQDLQRLLQRQEADVLAQRCLDALANPAAIVHLHPRPISSKEFHNIHERRAYWNQEENGSIEGYDTLMPALTRIADAGEPVCSHTVTLPHECFIIITDVPMQHLVGILANHSDKMFRYFQEHPEYR